MKPISGRRLVALAQERSWLVVSRRSSHVKLRNPITGAVIIVPVHANKDLRPGLQRSLMRQIGLADSDL